MLMDAARLGIEARVGSAVTGGPLMGRAFG
jgi:hypothetical protein